MRKTKFDDFILYHREDDQLVLMALDHAVNGVSLWWHYNGKSAWWTKGNDYLNKLREDYEVIDRLPERSL